MAKAPKAKKADKAKVKLKAKTLKGKDSGIYAEKIKRKDRPDLVCVLMDGPVPDPVWVTEEDLQ